MRLCTIIATYCSTAVNNACVMGIKMNEKCFENMKELTLSVYDTDGSVDLSHNMVSTPRRQRTGHKSDGSQQSVMCRIPEPRQRTAEWG